MRHHAVLVVAIALSAQIASADERPDQKVLRLVNRYRQIAGLTPVALDDALSAGCMQHADYMRQNAGTDAMAGLNAHTERPQLPGATPAGAACGKAADLFPGVIDLGLAVDGWMAGIYHRRPILDPQLARIGVGYAPLPDGSLMAALMLVDGTAPPSGGADGRGQAPPVGSDGTGTARWPVAYPARDQTDVPLEYANEVPNPVPGGVRGGYPITLQFPPFDPVSDVHATLDDATGAPLPIFLSDPEHPATSFGQFGVVSVIPALPLLPGGHYVVRIAATWRGKPGSWEWRFSTVQLRRVDATDEPGLRAALGVPSLVRGTVIYGGMMNPETAFLELAKFGGPGADDRLVSVIIPIAIWTKLVGQPAPSALVGTALEVESTPELYQNRYFNLPITTARQLHLPSGPAASAGACCRP